MVENGSNWNNGQVRIALPARWAGRQNRRGGDPLDTLFPFNPLSKPLWPTERLSCDGWAKTWVEDGRIGLDPARLVGSTSDRCASIGSTLHLRHRKSIMRRLAINCSCFTPTLVLLLWAAPPIAAQQATVTGRITDQASSQPVQDARVIVLGTSLVTLSGQDGHYTLRNVPVGTADVQVLRVGYQQQKKSVP